MTRLLAILLLAACTPVPDDPDAGPTDGGLCNLADRCETEEMRCRALADDFDWIDYDECLAEE